MRTRSTTFGMRAIKDALQPILISPPALIVNWKKESSGLANKRKKQQRRRKKKRNHLLSHTQSNSSLQETLTVVFKHRNHHLGYLNWLFGSFVWLLPPEIVIDRSSPLSPSLSVCHTMDLFLSLSMLQMNYMEETRV